MDSEATNTVLLCVGRPSLGEGSRESVKILENLFKKRIQFGDTNTIARRHAVINNT
jgi:hypothetical protein